MHETKIITLFLVGAMVFSLAACGSENTSQENNSEDAQTSQEKQDTDEIVETEDTGESADAGASVVVRDGKAVGNMPAGFFLVDLPVWHCQSDQYDAF